MTFEMVHFPTGRAMMEASETLWITDAEMIRRMGCPEKVAREAIGCLDKDPRRSGFPQKDKLWGNRRYWPAVKAWLDKANGLKIEPSNHGRQR